MCSRYFLDADGNIIAYTFRVPTVPGVQKRFNIAPTQQAPIVRVSREGVREIAMQRWGLVPFWAKDLKIGTTMINARSEGIEAKPAFREAVKSRRCIVPATGFFEWQGERPGRKQPFAITVPEMPLFAFAGLWEFWKRADDESVETFTIVTTDANEAVGAIHDRMPVILPAASYDRWLFGTGDDARALLQPSSEPIALRRIGALVGNSKNDVPEVLADPAPEPPPKEDRNRSLF